MKIAIIGYGKMGRAIEQVIIEENKHQILLKISEDNLHEFTIENLKMVDVAIDFTKPESAYHNVLKCFEADCPIVVGTTSWGEGLAQVKDICLKEGKTLFVSPNFSIGVNLFFRLNQQLNKLMQPYDDYKIRMEEIHHTQKLDSPSGTAIKLAEDLISQDFNYTSWCLGDSDNKEVIGIDAIREEGVPGTHTVLYESEIDKIEIMHEAKNRKGFAIGAVRAAEFLYNKKGYYSMEDLLNT